LKIISPGRFSKNTLAHTGKENHINRNPFIDKADRILQQKDIRRFYGKQNSRSICMKRLFTVDRRIELSNSYLYKEPRECNFYINKPATGRHLESNFIHKDLNGLAEFLAGRGTR
jgi:hypothetical protein